MKKLTYEFVKGQFEKEGWILESTEYVNSKQKLDYICPNWHKHSITWSKWQQGQRCLYCYYDSVKPTIEFIRSEFEKEGFIFLTTEYINKTQKLGYICSNGHKHSISWDEWSRLGNRCPYCYGNGKPTIEFIRSEFEKKGSILLTGKYINCYQKLEYICPRDHKHSMSWNNWRAGYRCPYCFGNISNGEIEVKDFIEFLGIKILPNNRNQIFNPKTGNGFELDIFMPDLNKAVEYNGEYWHRDKTRDLLKQELCELKGIDLLTVWDNEWRANNKECKDKIKSFVFNSERGI